MPDDAQNLTQDINVPPPSADSSKAEHYVDWLVDLLSKDKITISQTDLNQFPVVGMEDHYRVPLRDYEIEVSHSKHPNSGSDIYVMLFNNLSQIREGDAQKAILAYLNLNEPQFHKFRSAAHYQIQRIKKQEEEKRFEEAMTPVNQVLEQIEKEPDLDKDPVRTLKKDEEEKPKANLVKPPLPADNPETMNKEEVEVSEDTLATESLERSDFKDSSKSVERTQPEDQQNEQSNSPDEDQPKITITPAQS